MNNCAKKLYDFEWNYKPNLVILQNLHNYWAIVHQQSVQFSVKCQGNWGIIQKNIERYSFANMLEKSC